MSSANRAVLVAELLGLTACTTVIARPRPETREDASRIDHALNDREVELRFADGGVAVASDVRIEPPLVTWGVKQRDRNSAPLQSVSNLTYLSTEAPRQRGFGNGFAIGGLAGLLTGALAGVASGDDPKCPGPGSEVYFCISGTRSEKAVVFGLVLGVIGGLLGGTLGAVVGHHDEVHFDAR